MTVSKHMLMDAVVVGIVIATVDTPIVELTGFSYDSPASTADDRSTADLLNPNRIVEMVDFNASGDYLVAAGDPAVEGFWAENLAGTCVECYIEYTHPLLASESVAATTTFRGFFNVSISETGSKGGKVSGSISLAGANGAITRVYTPATP